jgi:glyoxylase-like metal-dependent hydrolase (beta-lactamase superfamily II)
MKVLDERFLEDLGIHRIETPVPFVEAGGPANVYALEDAGGGFTLFDCAVGTDEGIAALRAGLQSRGLELKDLKRIVISHGHVDHYGNAQLLAEETGAEIFIHPLDVEKICGEGRWFKQLEKSWSYFRKLGMPEPVLNAMLESGKKNRSFARVVDRARVKPLAEGMKLSFKHFECEVLHMPGHTSGLVCLWLAAQKLLFADDHVLARVSPNPLLDLTHGEGATKFKSLVAYYVSARRARDLEIDCILPGHGEAFSGHRELLDGLFEFYTARQGRLCKRLEKTGPSSVYDLISAVFPRVDVARMYLMLSEVLGNLEVLEADGKLRRIEDETSLKFALP